MRPLICLLIVLSGGWILNLPVRADEIVLNSGERFTSDRIWEENGKIRFNMHGLIVSVNPADVVSILRDGPASNAPPVPPPAAHVTPVIPTDNAEVQHQPERAVEPPREPSQPAAPEPKAKNTGARVRGIGIDGIQWQMRPAQIQGIEKISTDPAYGGIDQYAHAQGPLRLGDALLDGLVFGFWQGRLYTITIWVDGRPAYERLRQAVFQRYGKGRPNKSGLERHIWLEETTDRLLEFDDTLNTGLFWMRSRQLDRQVKLHYPEA